MGSNPSTGSIQSKGESMEKDFIYFTKQRGVILPIMTNLGFVEVFPLVFSHEDLPDEIQIDMSAIDPNKVILAFFQKFTKYGEQQFKEKFQEFIGLNEEIKKVYDRVDDLKYHKKGV